MLKSTRWDGEFVARVSFRRSDDLMVGTAFSYALSSHITSGASKPKKTGSSASCFAQNL